LLCNKLFYSIRIAFLNEEKLQCLSREECIEIYVKANVFVKYGVYQLHRIENSLTIPNDFYADSGIFLTSNEIVAELDKIFKKINYKKKFTIS